MGRINRRRRWYGRGARIARRLGLLKQPVQSFVYDATFRSDEEALSYCYALRNDHLPDLRNPVWFNEKIRWQFLNHPNPLMSLVADKISVRDYLWYKGATVWGPDIIATGADPEALALANLPARFALKSAYGSGQNHLETGVTRTPRSVLIDKVRSWMEWDQWRFTGEFHYRSVPKRWMVEEFVPSTAGQIEYKVFCMMGEPVFILAISERTSCGSYKRAIYTPDWQPVDFHWNVSPPVPEKPVPRPERLDEILANARLLSEDFLNVRVDFLQCDDRLVFSELTFASAAARIPFTPVEANVAMGELIDLTRAPEYLERGRRIAAELNWPMPTIEEPAFVWTGGKRRATQHVWQS